VCRLWGEGSDSIGAFNLRLVRGLISGLVKFSVVSADRDAGGTGGKVAPASLPASYGRDCGYVQHRWPEQPLQLINGSVRP
jgi:hypothetical protein